MEDIERSQSLADKPKQRYKSFTHIASVISSFALGAFYFGYSMGYFSSIDFDTIMKIYGIEWERTTAQGVLTGCLPIGGGIGALSSNILTQKFSRRYFVT